MASGVSEYLQAGDQEQNVGEGERWMSLLTGGGLVLAGARRGGLSGLLLAGAGACLMYRGATGHCAVYEQFGMSSYHRSPAAGVRARHGYKVEKTLSINRPASELYAFWRNPENLPRVMNHLVSVQRKDDRHSHWVARGPFGSTVEWDAEINNERQNELIAWRSLPGSQLDTAGSVHFDETSGDRGTIVRISLKYDPPGGKLGATIASLLGDGLEQQLREDLQRFKQLVESGEIELAAR